MAPYKRPAEAVQAVVDLEPPAPAAAYRKVAPRADCALSGTRSAVAAGRLLM